MDNTPPPGQVASTVRVVRRVPLGQLADRAAEARTPRVRLRDLRTDRPLPLALARILAGESGAGSGQFSSSI